MNTGIGPVATTLVFGLLSTVVAFAQDLQKNVVYVCNGERLVIDSCNIRDLSDTSTCMVGHPDTVLPNGIMKYTTETRGTLKKLLPTCKQPSTDQIARAKAAEKKQNDLYEANVKKANEASSPPPSASAQPTAGNASLVRPPKTPEERAIRRCVSSGRLVATCTGNSLLGAFGQMISSVLPSAAKEPAPGPVMAGVYQGAGNWRLDFIDGGVLVNCSTLSPNQQNYTLELKNGHTLLTIDTTPKPLVLTFKPDGTIVGPGPVTIDGVVAAGYVNGAAGTNAQYKDQYGNLYDAAGNRVPGNENAGHTVFSPRKATCPALNLTSKGAGVGVQTMQTDLLKSMFSDGDKGPPTPPGIRMRGIFAASTGFSAEFYPESVILGCGPDAARAYPYSVVADGARAQVKIDAPDHPLTLAFQPDGSLDAGSGSYQVHGRIVTGQNDNGDFTFAPMEQTCNLGVLSPSKQIPAVGGTAATMTASAGASGAGPANGGGTLSTPAAPLGNATLTIVSGFPAQQGTPNPLAGRPYVLLRDSYANSLAKGGVSVPTGMSPYKYAANACASRTPDCQKITDAIKVAAASAVRADANGGGIFPGVPPGSYYLMISTRYNNQALMWGQAVQLKPGQNSMTLDPTNAVVLN
jgi:hypothetical protein